MIASQILCEIIAFNENSTFAPRLIYEFSKKMYFRYPEQETNILLLCDLKRTIYTMNGFTAMKNKGVSPHSASIDSTRSALCVSYLYRYKTLF